MTGDMDIVEKFSCGLRACAPDLPSRLRQFVPVIGAPVNLFRCVAEQTTKRSLLATVSKKNKLR